MSWLNDNRFKIGLVGSVLGIAYLGGRYFDYMDEQQAKSYGAEKKSLARNTIKAKGRNSYDRFKHIMEMKVKMLSPHMKKKYAKENRLPSFTSGGTTRYWQAFVDGWREMEKAKVKDMGDVIGLGFKPENAFSVNEYWGRIDGAEAYMDWSAGRKDTSGYYSKAYFIPTEEYDVPSMRAEKKNCGCGKNPCVTYGAETFDAMSFKQWSDDEMHEPKHGGSHMQFDDWLDDEIKSHGDIPLSKWGYEEEHDEKEHQHSETFDAEEKQGICDTCGRKRWWFENKRGEISGQVCGYGYTLEKAKKAHETGIPADFCRGMVNNPFIKSAETFEAKVGTPGTRVWVEPEGCFVDTYKHGIVVQEHPRHSKVYQNGKLLKTYRGDGHYISATSYARELEWNYKPKTAFAETFNADDNNGWEYHVYVSDLEEYVDEDGDSLIDLTKQQMVHSNCGSEEGAIKKANEVSRDENYKKYDVIYVVGEHEGGDEEILYRIQKGEISYSAETFNAQWKEGDKGKFVGGDGFKIIAIEDLSHLGKANVIIYERLDEEGNELGFIRTTSERGFPKKKNAETFNAESMTDRFAKRFPDHKILRDRKGMMAKFRKSQLDDRNWVGWVQLTGYGKQPCILASDLKVGDHIVYNTGASAEVVEIKPKGKATLTVSAISDHDGNTYDRDYRKLLGFLF